VETMTVGPEQRDQPDVPRRLGRYELHERLGEGGMGVVHLATDDRGDEVAIKVLRPHIAHDPQARQRLEREVHTLSRVDHPRVAAVLDADVHGPAPYIVTEYVPGPPLDAVVRERGPVQGEDLVRLGRGLSEALTAIHGVGIVHRDLKPGNVLMVGPDPVVIDFGIAQVADDARLTMTGMVMGTPGYLSPEVVEGGAVTEATDWWGWAATLAFANSGEPPFGTGPMSVVLDRVIRGRTQLDRVDPELRPLLSAALDPDPRHRPRAVEVMRALELYAAHRPVTAALTEYVPSAAREAGPTTPAHPWPAPGERHTDATVRQGPAPAPTHVQPVGRTRVQPVPPPSDGWGSPAEGRPDATGRLADGLGQAPPSPYQPAHPYQPPYPAGQDPRIGRPTRSGTIVALGAAFVGLSALAPLVAWGLLAVWSVLARTTDHAITSLVLRRHETGPRRSDVPVAVITSPWHLVRGALGAALALLLPVGFAVAAVVITASVLTEFSTVPASYDDPVPVAVGTLLGAVIAWWGPGGVSLRRGSRTMVRAALPSVAATQVAVAVLGLGGTALLAYALVRGVDVSWWPSTFERAPFTELIPEVLRP
jgi:serine/threonine protein kinase